MRLDSYQGNDQTLGTQYSSDMKQMEVKMLKRGFKDMLAEANAVIEVLAVQDLNYALDDPEAVLVDVRDQAEREHEGFIPGSLHASRGMLEFHADPESPMHMSSLKPERSIIVYCGTGGRSALAAKTLGDMGFQNVRSLAGGFAAWKQSERSR